MSEVIEKIVSAVHWKYQGGSGKVETTDLYFNDGTKLVLDGHWNFKIGESYRIEHVNGNPVDVENITMKL